MKDRNAEGYPDPTAARAIKAADRPPEEIIMFRKMSTSKKNGNSENRKCPERMSKNESRKFWRF